MTALLGFREIRPGYGLPILNEREAAGLRALAAPVPPATGMDPPARPFAVEGG